MNTDKKNKIMAIFITVAAFLVLGGIGFAFFSSAVSNDNNEKFQTETATMRLVFSDNDNGISGNLNLGESIVKKFTLENTGTVDAYGKINWVDLVNTYTSDSLTWTLEQSTSENGTYTSIGSGKVPTSSTGTTKQLKNGILVPVNTTYYYKLTITLNNLDIDQSSDINAHMNSKFSLEAGTKPGIDTIMELVAGEPTNTTDVITKPAPVGATCTNTLAYDGTVDNNLRYVGVNPCNYVTFNGESPTTEEKWDIVELSTGNSRGVGPYDSQNECQSAFEGYGSPTGDGCQSRTLTTGGWRIVGIMNNVDDGTGSQETRIKLIRATSLGGYSWDTSDSNVNIGDGINDWTQADLKNELNGDYLNTNLNANTTWYNGSSNAQTGVYDYTKGLKASAQAQIGNTKWYLGGQESSVYNAAGEGTAAKFYGYERGNTVWVWTKTCNDGYCPRATSWIGKVALIYPSDYGYAVGGSVRSTCLGKNLNTYYNDNCYTNDWLCINNTPHWLLSPDSGGPNYAFYVGSTGYISSIDARNTSDVLPSVYLESSVTISGGNGTESEPFQIS